MTVVRDRTQVGQWRRSDEAGTDAVKPCPMPASVQSCWAAIYELVPRAASAAPAAMIVPASVRV